MAKNNLFLLKLVWKECPGRILAELGVQAFGYLSWVFYSIYFLKYIMSALESGKEFGSIFFFLVGSALIFGAGALLENWFQREYRELSDVALYEKINGMLFHKAANVELECYEDTEFYNKYTLAMKETEVRISAVLQNVSAVFCGVAAGTVVMWNMYRIDHLVVLFVLSPMLGNFVFGRLANKLVFERDKACIPYRRRMEYVNRTVYLADYAKEIRMTNIFNVLRKLHGDGFKGVYGILKKYQGKGSVLSFMQNFFTFFVIFQGVMLYGLYKTLTLKTMELSSFVVLSNAMVTGAWILINLSTGLVGMYQNGLYISNLREFIEYEPKRPEDGEGAEPEPFSSLEIRDAGFTYRGQETPTLEKITFTVKKGEKIAIVGHNGAGKTTLIKLLLRLYDTDTGKILYNGKDIREYRIKSYRALFSTAFQDFQLFSMTVAENILMRRPEGEADYRKVAEALTLCGMYEKVMSLPQGMDTMLTREFAADGAVLSGGEAQKIAVARAFASDYEVAVFDEPSSALDPIAEYRLYESMMKSCDGKTVFFISHRLSTAALADRVYLFENGRIVESGSHRELMEAGGAYADMFEKQARSYREEVTVGRG